MLFGVLFVVHDIWCIVFFFLRIYGILLSLYHAFFFFGLVRMIFVLNWQFFFDFKFKEEKFHIHILVIDHVDHGKSTIANHLINKLDRNPINQKEAYEKFTLIETTMKF